MNIRSTVLTGKKFYMLTAIRPLNTKESGQSSMYECICECGKIRNVKRYKLISGNARSCGCTKFAWEHGNRKYKNAEEPSWNALINRCKNSAKARHIEWLLSKEEALAIFIGNCTYCGVPPKQPYNVYRNKNSKKQVSTANTWIDTGNILYNGIDRIDSKPPIQNKIAARVVLFVIYQNLL